LCVHSSQHNTPPNKQYSNSNKSSLNMPSMILWCQPDEAEGLNLRRVGAFEEQDHSSDTFLRVLPRSWSEDETDSRSSSTTTTRMTAPLSTALSSDSQTRVHSNDDDVLQQQRRPKAARAPLGDITCRTLNSRTLRSSNNNSNRQ
jgi:hypothetical protein